MINSDLFTTSTRCTNLSNFTNDNLIKMINLFFMGADNSSQTEIKQNKELEKRTHQNHGDFDAFLDLTNEYIEKQTPSLRNVCSRVFQRLGFNISINGTKYLIEAILYVFENNIDELKLKIIYQELSKKFSVPTYTIKSSIHYSVTSALPAMQKKQRLLSHIFHEYDGRIPNTKYLISIAVYELRYHLRPYGYDDKRIEKILFYA